MTGLAVPAAAQSVPTGRQEYFVLAFDQHVWDMMDKVQNGEGGAQFVDGMNSVVTATASADNQVIYYDHWEDGLEADVLSPVQVSTLVIGDGDPANGDACDFNNDVCGVDLLMRGSFVSFASNQGLGGGCTVPSADPSLTGLCLSVPVNPRCAGACTAAEIRFDGGDLIETTGGPLSLIHNQDPLTQFIGGATEILSRQAVEAARSYSVPVGEDLYVANSPTEPFHYVDLNLVAFEDGTQVLVNSPGAGTVAFTLDRGEHWSSLGFIDNGAFNASLLLTINAGTKISTSAPIAGLLFTGGDGTFATRHYALLPDILHSTDYVLTAPGDDPAAGPGGSPTDRPLVAYIFNPDPFNAIDVQVTDSVGTATVNVPPNSAVDYLTAMGRYVPSGSTARMTSDRNFWGISAYDHDTNISDWGHSWLATKFLTGNYTVGFAPGNFDPTSNFVNLNGVFVAATADNTHVQFDLDNDGVFDPVDTDGDGVVDAAPLPDNTYVVNALESMRAFDPSDFDMTGTRIVANKPVAVAWGQDTDLTGFGDAAMDTGYTVYPVDQLFLDPVLLIEKTVASTVLPIAGGIATYTLTVTTYDFGPITDLEVYDLLPPGVAGADYVPGSTLVTYPDLTQSTADPVASIDPGTGRDRLDWTLSPDTLQANQTLTIRYSVDVPASPGGLPRLLVNEAHAEGMLGGSVFAPLDTAEVTQTDLELTKSVDFSQPEAGDVLTFTLNVTNNGLVAETGVIVSDPIPPDTTFVPGSITSSGPFSGTYSAGQNAVTWTAASFPVGGPHALTFEVQVNPGVPAGTMIPNRGSYESNETPLFLSNQVEPLVIGPEIVVTKTGPALLHPNETATFEIHVQNVGSGAADTLVIVDPFPNNATYLAGSMLLRRNALPFVALTDAADVDEGTAFVDRLEVDVASLGPGEDLTFRFQVQVDPGTTGQFVSNQATVDADGILPVVTNLVQIPIVGNADVTGHVFLDLDGDGVQDAGEPDLADVDVAVTDSQGNVQIVTTDANGDYLATVGLACYEDGFAAVAYDGSDGDLNWNVAGDQWIEFGTGADQNPATTPLAVEADPLGVFGNSLLIEGGPSGSNRGFTRQVNLSAAAGFAAGQATLSFNYRRVSMETGDDVELGVDYDDNGTFDLLQTYLGGAGDDAAWQSASFTLDAGQLPANPVVIRFLGTIFNFASDNFYVDNVQVCNAQVTVNVDETDPDFPPGATLSTANDPQTVAAVAGGTAAATPVGYQPLALTFSKVSDAGGEVVPGQTVTYTLTMTNNTGVTQTGISISDPLPAGTSAVPGSTVVETGQTVMRVTEYFLGVGEFPGTVYDLTLDQDLAANYFVIVQGSDGNGTGGGGNSRGPDENYARLTQDPFGTGDLAASAGADVIRLQRGAAVNSWVGVVTVVECLSDCGNNGFVLRDALLVTHADAATSGLVVTSNPWPDVNQVMLVGGYNGSGCGTAVSDADDTKTCHARIFPSGLNEVNWTRSNGGGVTLGTAFSTVMVVDWGDAWTVQRRRVQGDNGGPGVNAAGEYNTAAINPVARDNTWVWGTGHTNDQGSGDAGEGVVLTLGNGVTQNATESLLAAGIEFGGNAVDFEVYALTHPDLAVDYRFKADDDSGSLTVDVTVDAATENRMALAYNGLNDEGTSYPRPMFSARYLNDTTVRLERRRNNDEFPAWVQGIDFSGLNQQIAAAGGDPPNLVVPGDGYTLAPGATLTVTFQVTVDDPLAPAISQIDNTATLNTDQQGPFMASATDDVVRLGVTVEPNNAGFTVAGGSVTYTHFVTNVGEAPDSYALTLISELGYAVELLDPDTGAVIAVDGNGDGVWDGGQLVNTGTLAVGESVEYRLRVNVPLGTPLGTEETTALIATSDRGAGTFAFATDETTVVDSIDLGPVALDPDHSGVVASGGSIAYTHTVTNNTGAPDTFDLTAFPTLPGWTATIYNDSNGDGVYTPGVDVAIANTLQLSDGQLQTIFVVVEAPPGAPAGDTDVVHLTAISRNDPALFDAATDTTTVIPATTHDLSGGGTRLVTPSSTAVFPGTLKNLSTAADRFDFTVTASLFFGLDGLNHPTQLWIDTNADGVPDTQIAEDADGDGDWDTIAPGFDVDGDLNPDVAVAGGSGLAYELRRPVDPAQLAYRDPVTLAAISQATGERDSVTATNLLPAATHALLAGFEVYAAGGEVVVEWTTASEVGTVGFYLVRTDAAGRQERLPRQRLLPSLLHAPQGGTYRFVDAGARPDALYGYRLVEVDVRGAERRFGPFEAVADRRRGEAPSKLLATGYVKQAHTSLLAPPADPAVPPKASAPPSGWVRLPVDAAGMAFVAAADLAAGWGETEATVAAWIQSGQVRVALNPFPLPLPAPCAANPGGIFRDGFESGDTCAWSALVDPRYVTTPIAWLGAAGGAGLYFYGEAIDSPFTTDNVYWISRGAGLLMGSRDGGAPAPAAGGSFPERLHFEQEAFPLTSVISNPDSDFWFWDFFLAGNAAHGSKSFTVTTPAPAAGTGATLTVRLHGQTDDPDVTPDHHVEVRWNGTLVGEARWDGGTAHRVDLAVPAGLVAGGANTVEITSRLAAGVVGDVLYLESLDVAYARRYRAAGDRLEAGATAAVVTVEGFSASDVTVFDVTDPRRPNVVVNATLDEVGGEHRVSFARNTAASRYLALRLDALPAAALEVDLASGLRSAGNRGAYLVLAGAGLETAAESLADYRRSLGLEAMTVRLQDVYDEFNAGVASPLAIRDFLAHAARRWQLRPRWVVLAGDGSFDYKDLLGAGDNLVPALMAATADGLFPSDHRFADGGGGVPSVFIGRIPARTNAELAAYVAKLQAYESAGGAWRGEAVWVADDADEGGEFLADTETLVPLVPLAAERVYVDDVGAAGARQELLAAIRSGALLVSYLGHGGPDRLADEGLLLTGDVASLDNAERLPVLTALTCSVGRFDFPGFATLSETLVRSAGGGVVAVLSPSGLSFNAEARQLGEAFLGRALTPSKTIGEAVAGALAEYAASPGADRDLPYLFILLGDPAIRLDP